MAREDSATSTPNSATWTLTERFRAHVRDMAANTAYETLADLSRSVLRTSAYDAPPSESVDEEPDDSAQEQSGMTFHLAQFRLKSVGNVPHGSVT